MYKDNLEKYFSRKATWVVPLPKGEKIDLKEAKELSEFYKKAGLISSFPNFVIEEIKYRGKD